MTPYDWIVRHLLPQVEFHQNRYARELDRAVLPGCRWLDIGAGGRVHGGWLRPSQGDLAARAGCLCGCDLAPRQLAANPHLRVRVVAHGGALPFPDGSFDVVTANMVVEHLPDPVRVFAEVGRVLRAGGKFVFVTPNRRHPLVWLVSVLVSAPRRRLLARWADGRPLERIFPTFYRANTRRDIRLLAAAADLRVGQVTVFPSYPMLRRPWPLTLLEAAWIRTLRWRPLDELGSNLVGVLEKPLRPACDAVWRPGHARVADRGGRPEAQDLRRAST